MLRAFWISTRLRITYQVNSILYWMKRIPLLRNMLPPQPYQLSWLKTLALVLALMRGLFSFFFRKLLYFGVWFVPAILYLVENHGADPDAIFLHIFLFLTLSGTIFYNGLTENDANSHYAVILMGMDARRYALSNYLFFLFKTALGFAGAAAVVCVLPLTELQFGDPRWIWLLPLLAVSAKLLVAAGGLALFHKTGKLLLSRSKVAPIIYVAAVLLLAAAYGLPFLGWTVPSRALYMLTALLALAALPAAVYLARCQDYRRIYQADPYMAVTVATVNQTLQDGYQKKLILEADSSKTGCAYFNDLFFQRHRKLLLRPARRIALIIVMALLGLFVAMWIEPELTVDFHKNLMSAFPFFPLLMYMINRGQTTTQILFFNCDYSMLSYRFYRRPSVLLPLFWARLRMLIRLNLLPGAVLAFGLSLLLLYCGGSNQPLDYLLPPIIVLSLSVFYSTHYLVLYYLLQPFTAGLETKNPAYSIITLGTYMASYQVVTRLGKLISPILFGVICIAFSLLYVLLALLLAHRLAPKTFRLRQ